MRWTPALIWPRPTMTGITALGLFASSLAIPAAFAFQLTSDAHLLGYFCGATELGPPSALAVAAQTADGRLKRADLGHFAAAHIAEAGLTPREGVSRPVLANGGAHAVIALLFIFNLSAGPSARGAVAQPRRV